MRGAGRGRFRKAQFAPGLRLGALDGQQGDARHRWQSDFPGSKFFQLGFDVGFSEQIRSDLGRIVDDDIFLRIEKSLPSCRAGAISDAITEFDPFLLFVLIYPQR